MKTAIVILIVSVIFCILAIRFLVSEVYETQRALLEIQAILIDHFKGDLANMETLKEFGESMEHASINRGDKLN